MNKLSDYCDLIPGFAFKSQDFGKGNDKVIKIGDIEPPIVNLANSSCIDLTNYGKIDLQKYKISSGDFVLAMTGATIGKVGRIASGDAYVNQRVLIFKPKEDVSKDYLFYVVLNNPFGKYILNSVDSNSAQPNISAESIGDYPVVFPSLSDQKKVGKLLSTIDTKISINNSICSDLESMAKFLYDYWFVQFDFPDENGRPYKSSGGKMVWNEELKREIPDGWKVKKMKGLYQIEKGLSYSSEDIATGDGVPMINLACIDRSRNYRAGELKYHSGNVPDSSVVNAGDLLIACTDLTREREIIGCPILVPDDGNKYTYSTDIAKISFLSGELDDLYMYMALRTDSYHNYIKAWASGTTVLHLNLQGLDWYDIVVPPIALQQRFADVIKNIHSKKSEVLEENEQLAGLRNFLLPMLMNGQVKVGKEDV